MDIITSELLKGNNLEDFLEKSKKSGNYKEAYNFVKDLGKISPMISQKLKLIAISNQPNDFSSKSIAKMVLNTEGVKINSDGEYIGKDGELIKIDGDIATFSTVGINGFKLKTGNINIKEIKEKTKELKEEYKGLMESGNEYFKNVELKNKIIEIKNNGGNDEVIGNLLNENGFNSIEDLNQEIELQKEEYNDKKENYLKSNKEIKKYVLKEKKTIEEKEKKQKETLKFLSKIGFDLVPQYITEQLINNININPDLYGFDSNVDLENGDLGYTGYGDDYLGSRYKEKFTDFFIKILGNPQMNGKDIFNKNNINNSSSVIDSSNLNLYLNTNGYKGSGSFIQMKDKLLKKEKV
ncbi:MAG: hypothetical protein Q9M97_09475 [Candidatus Gracilibacteria bacterium]|nr:hypothetical protein [Candidatus Gracilibacteria bacterium]